MKKSIISLFERVMSRYQTESTNEVDFGHEESHSWMRFYSQNFLIINLYSLINILFWIMAYLDNTAKAYGLAIGVTLLFVSLLSVEKWDEETFGFMRSGREGEYWRARQEWLKRRAQKKEGLQK